MNDLPQRQQQASGHEPAKPITRGVTPVPKAPCADRVEVPDEQERQNDERRIFAVSDSALKRMGLRWVW